MRRSRRKVALPPCLWSVGLRQSRLFAAAGNQNLARIVLPPNAQSRTVSVDRRFYNSNGGSLMKRLALITSVTAIVIAAAVAASAQTKPNFAGAWALDKSKSQGLDQRMANVDVTWTITQDDAKISIESKVTGGNAGGGQPPAGGGGGNGGGGGRGMGGASTYTLDGKEVTTEGGCQMVGTKTTKAAWSGGTL